MAMIGGVVGGKPGGFGSVSWPRRGEGVAYGTQGWVVDINMDVDGTGGRLALLVAAARYRVLDDLHETCRADSSAPNRCLRCYWVGGIGVRFVDSQPRCGTFSVGDGWFESLVLLGWFGVPGTPFGLDATSDSQAKGAQI